MRREGDKGLFTGGDFCNIEAMSQSKEGMTIPPELEAEMTPAVRAFVRLLLDRVAALESEVAELKAELAAARSRREKTPENSSKPPSTQHPHAKPKRKKPKTSGKKRGAQKGHPKHQRALVPSGACDEVVPLRPTACRRCGEALRGDDPEPLRHQVWELPEIRPTITEYQRYRLTCSCCGTATTAALPDGVPTGQSGPRLVAFVSLLMAFYRQSKRRTAWFVNTMFGIPCSAGLTVKHQNLATAALASCYDELVADLPQAAVANMDETASKQAGQKSWLWVAVTGAFTVFAVRLTRAACVVRGLLGDDYSGTIGCDRYASYNSYRRQFCWAHLKRDFQRMIDVGGASQPIGQRLMDVVEQLFHHWHRYRGGILAREAMRQEIEALKYPVWAALEDGMRCRQRETTGACTHLFDHFDHLWTFLDHDGVEPTNNAAERALRHAVIWRKLSFGTQSEKGSRFVETMLTIIETCRQQDRSVLAFVTEAVTAKFASHPAPSLRHEP